ncbi:MAG: CRISPR-associated endonuclease Cas3'', partial [Dehalococcoidia bacterium]|nr:CRISPR-associated endonuclease Cas3'' [Dehalococcoidia bacterium]
MSAVAGSQVDLLALWAKLGQQDETFRYHPLLFHLLDTVAVAEQLWERALTPRLRRAIADGFGISSEAAGRWATVLVALHDLGKATPDFQFRLPKPKGELEQKAAQHVAHAGFPVPRLPPTALLRHGEALSLVLPPLLRARGLELKVACALADAVGGHHGRFPVESRFARQRSALDGEIWSSARRHLFELLVSLLHVPEETPRQADVPSLVLLAGLTTVAD